MNRQVIKHADVLGALHRADEFTVALLDLKTDDLRFLTVAR